MASAKVQKVDTTSVGRQIEEAIDHEERTHTVKQALYVASQLVGRRLSDGELNQCVQFIAQYLREVPLQLSAIRQAAAPTRFLGQVNEIIAFCLRYWKEPNDFIPDHLGLLGIMDDGYVTMCLLQRISERCQAQIGQSLLSENWQQGNQTMRSLIGSPVVEQLDAYIANALHEAPPQNLFTHLAQLMNAAQLSASQFPRSYNPPDPIWGNASPREIANVRLGAMGIV